MNSKLKPLNLCVTIVLILGIITGVILICITTYYHRMFSVYFAISERPSLVGHFSSIYLLAFEFLGCYSIGLMLWHFIWKSESILEYTQLLAALNGFFIFVFICGSMTVWFQFCSIQSFKTAAETSLFQGIDLYFSEPEWKLIWDEIQFYNGCCGVNGYDDWKDAVWMPDDQARLYDSNILLMIPYACCKRSVASCFQNYAPHVGDTQVPYINSTDINTNGCLSNFCDDTYRLFYYAAGTILIVLLLQVGLIIISKAKIFFFGLRNGNNDNDQRPLVIVKCPRNVRCITLTDEENFDDVDEEEGEKRCILKCRTSASEDFFHRQEITNSCQPVQTIFLH